MRSGLRIKDHYITQGITNSLLAERAGIKISDLYIIPEHNPFIQSRVKEKILNVINDKRIA